MTAAPHSFSLRQLQYAVAVAEELSFRRAAEKCHVSQPSLSAQLALLEEALGVQLFERDRRRVLPTAAGQVLVERARRVLLEADDLVEAAKRVSDPLVGTLRIGVLPTISPYLLPRVTPRLRRKFERLGVAWREDKTDVLVKNLGSGTLDAALLALEADLGDVEHDVIARDPFYLVTPTDHPLAKKSSPASRADLHDADILLLDDGHCLRTQALDVCSRANARELEFRATSLPTLVQMVAGGAGITLLPALSIPTETQRAHLHIRPFTAPAPGRTIALVWRKRSPLTLALHQVAAVIRDAYPPMKK
ncbi:LysR substrate-binding domain-containing protein [Pendulispora albinea]|uniref:LysR substrate-binding domain-containing protein n=1 Tax=Pendulispora albinea TaxID=2741071 RepID=UPI00374E1FA1